MAGEVDHFLHTQRHPYPSNTTVTPGVMFFGSNSTSVPDNDTDMYFLESYEDMQEMIHFQFYAWSVTGTAIASLGLLGNILSITVLCHRRMRSPTSCYLAAIAIYDSLVLISHVLAMSLPVIYQKTERLQNYAQLFTYINPVLYPIALISQTCSIYTTVGFTVERYIAVCLPLRVAKMCTIARARKSILAILLCSVIYNIPRMLEYRIPFEVPRSNMTELRHVYTALGQSPIFRYIYHIGMHMVVMLIIPFFTLMALNILLIRAVRRSAHTKGRVTKKQRRENNLTVMLLSVVVVFLILQVLSIVDIACMATLPTEKLHTLPFIKLTCIAALMVITNSAVNFYLYCVFGQKFRCVFARIYCLCLPRGISKRFLDDSLTRIASHKDTSPPVSQACAQRPQKLYSKLPDSTWMALTQTNGNMYAEQSTKGKFVTALSNGPSRHSNL